MKSELIHEISHLMSPHLSPEQNRILKLTLNQVFTNFNLPDSTPETPLVNKQQNSNLINLFVAAKKIEGCSDNTLKYYFNTLTKMINTLQKKHL